MSGKTGVLLLAAGASRRFGGDKRLAVLPSGRTMLEQAVEILTQSGLPFYLVLRQGDPLAPADVARLEVDRAEEGMATSIAQAVSPLAERYQSLLIMPVDLPLLKTETLRKIAGLARQDRITRPECDGRVGHPVAFGKVFFPALQTLRGDGGARTVIQENPAALETVAVDDPGIFVDIDTPEQLAELSRPE